MNLKVGILNVTGYAGSELARILHRHPDAEITSVTGRSRAGEKLGDVFPHLADLGLTVTEDLTESADVVFSALPATASAERLAGVLDDGARVVDISADFRLKDVSEYREWYDADHPAPQYLEDAVYGLPELYREAIVSADLVANPGCYPTAAILALAPAVRAGLIGGDIVVDAKSGVSGAGRGLSMNTHYSEVNENVVPYAVAGHRHLPEITQELGGVNGAGELNLTFLPHLVPMTRGIVTSCYAPIRRDRVGTGESASNKVREIYKESYEDEPFVRLTDSPPATKHTLGNNTCNIFTTVDHRSNTLIALACIDNLIKGAAGQAVQNMNIMFGLPETEGLEQLALYP